MMTHHFVMTSSLRIKNFKIDKFVDKMDIFRDDISLIVINQSHLQATEGSLRRTQSVRQLRSASKRSALVLTVKTRLLYIYIYICNELIEETAERRRLIFGMRESFGYDSTKF